MYYCCAAMVPASVKVMDGSIFPFLSFFFGCLASSSRRPGVVPSWLLVRLAFFRRYLHTYVVCKALTAGQSAMTHDGTTRVTIAAWVHGRIGGQNRSQDVLCKQLLYE